MSVLSTGILSYFKGKIYWNNCQENWVFFGFRKSPLFFLTMYVAAEKNRGKVESHNLESWSNFCFPLILSLKLKSANAIKIPHELNHRQNSCFSLQTWLQFGNHVSQQRRYVGENDLILALRRTLHLDSDRTGHFERSGLWILIGY